jgi:hypothetical protein
MSDDQDSKTSSMSDESENDAQISDALESQIMMRTPSFVDVPDIPSLSGVPGDFDFDVAWTRSCMFCRDHFIADSPLKQLKITKLLEFFAFLRGRSANALGPSHVDELVSLLRSGLLRPLWRVDARTLRADAGELKQMQDGEHAELVILYGILTNAAKRRAFSSEINFAFVADIAGNLCSADADERRIVSQWLRECAQRGPATHQRILSHLVVMLDEMSQNFALPGVGSILSLIRELAATPRALVIAHVLPLLGNPGLVFFSDDLVPWLCELSGDREFREKALHSLIRHFPLTNRKSTVILLNVFERIALDVPLKLVRPLLAIVGNCCARDDHETNAAALAFCGTPALGAMVDKVQVFEVTPMLETLLVGARVRHRRLLRRRFSRSPTSGRTRSKQAKSLRRLNFQIRLRFDLNLRCPTCSQRTTPILSLLTHDSVATQPMSCASYRPITAPTPASPPRSRKSRK